MDPTAANSSKPANEPWLGKGWVAQDKKVSELSIEPNLSRDLYCWVSVPSEVTEDDVLRSFVILAGIARLPLPQLTFPAPTSWTHEALSKASELCRETNFLELAAVCEEPCAGPCPLAVVAQFEGLDFESCLGHNGRLTLFHLVNSFYCVLPLWVLCHWQFCLCSLPILTPSYDWLRG